MRVGLYLGRHAGSGGGIAVYARCLVQHLVELLSDPRYEHFELVVYGESKVLDAELRKELSLAEVLVSEAGGSIYRGASSYFRKLPNGARSRVLVRPLGETLGRHPSSVIDQLLLPMLIRLDNVQLLHSLANVGILLSGRPQVITMHDLYQAWPVADSDNRQASWIQRLYRVFFRAQCRIASYLITDAQHVADEIVARFCFSRARIRVVPLGLDRVFRNFISIALQHRRSAEAETQQTGNLPREPGYILMFASADPRKNLDRTLAAWAALPSEFHDRLLIAVAPQAGIRRELRNFVKAHSADDRRLEICEWVERGALPQLYAGAAVVLVPTLAEGFGLPALEAHALGVSVVCGDVEYIGDKGPVEGVFRCDPKSEDAITQALQQALQDSSESGAKPESFADDIRTMSDAACDTLALYGEIGLRYITQKL